MPGLFYLHAVEAAGSWWCRRGRTEIDEHETLGEALCHLRVIGATEARGVPFEIVVHPLDGPPQFLRGDDIARIRPCSGEPSVMPKI